MGLTFGLNGAPVDTVDKFVRAFQVSSSEHEMWVGDKNAGVTMDDFEKLMIFLTNHVLEFRDADIDKIFKMNGVLNTEAQWACLVFS